MTYGTTKATTAGVWRRHPPPCRHLDLKTYIEERGLGHDYAS